MFLFNITFVVAAQTEHDFLKWVSKDFIPELESSSEFTSPLLTRIISHNPDDEESQSYALQFKAPTIDSINLWMESNGNTMLGKIREKHGESILSFATFMEII